MGILDRYLLRQFAQIFLISFCSLTGLFIVIDAFSHIDEFISIAEHSGGLLKAIGGYYSYRCVFFFDRTSGILVLIASMFTVTWIQRHHELTAIMAAGISRSRVIMPIIAAGVSISGLSAVSREMLIPRLADELSRDPNDLAGDDGREYSPRYDGHTDILFQGQFAFANERRLSSPTLLLPARWHAWSGEISGKNAYFEPPSADHPAGYRITEVRQPRGIDGQPPLLFEDETIVYTRQNAADWLKPGECFVISEMNFELLRGGHNWRKFSSTATLVRGLKNPSLEMGAEVKVAIHTRLLQPVMDITLLLLGLPLVLTKENRNIFLAIGMCIVLVSVFMLVTLGCQYLGKAYLIDPALAAWLPLLIFGPLAAFGAEPLFR